MFENFRVFVTFVYVAMRLLALGMHMQAFLNTAQERVLALSRKTENKSDTRAPRLMASQIQQTVRPSSSSKK